MEETKFGLTRIRLTTAYSRVVVKPIDVMISNLH
jgi:hypothetical protein